mgnify:CR=1 FL=1
MVHDKLVTQFDGGAANKNKFVIQTVHFEMSSKHQKLFIFYKPLYIYIFIKIN